MSTSLEEQSPVQLLIAAKLTEALHPSVLEITVVDASSGKFKVKVVSDAFKGKATLQRHRAVNGALKEELLNGTIHALEIVADAPAS